MARIMTQLLQSDSKPVHSSPLDNPWRFLDLVHGASEHLIILTAVAVAVSWVPLAILSALRGGSTFLSFLTDYASQSRFLIILPVLILGSPSLHKRLARVAHHLEDFVQESQISTFKSGWASFERLRNSTIAKGVMVLLTYSLALWLAQYLSPQGAEIVGWWKDPGGFRWFSPAGTWALFVSYPIVGPLDPALAVEAIALDTIPVGHGALEPSPHRRPPRWRGRHRVCRVRSAWATTF